MARAALLRARHTGSMSVLAEAGCYVALGAILFTAHLHWETLAFLAFVSTTSWVLLIAGMPPRIWLPAFTLLAYLVSLAIISWLWHVDPVAWLVAPLLYIPFFLLLGVAASFILKRQPGWPTALIWAVLFTSAEWIRIKFGPGEISLGQLGYAVAGYPYLIQIADMFGVSILTFMLAASAGLAADIVLALRGVRRTFPWASGVAVSLLVGSVLTYGAFRIGERSLSPGPTVAVIQPNLPSWLEGDPASARLDVLEELTRNAIAARPADLVVWPENSITASYLNHEAGLKEPYKSRLLGFVRGLGVPLLLDGPADDDQGRLYHTTTLIRPDATIAWYDKRKLVPWSEFIPFERTLSSINEQLAIHYGSLVTFVYPAVERTEAGAHRVQPLLLTAQDAGGWRFGTPNCFEIASATAVNEWHGSEGENGVHFLVNPANEVLLGPTIHLQMLRTAQLRAVEGRTTVIRAANNGISALVDSNGGLANVLRSGVDGPSINVSGFGHFEAAVDARNPTTYARIGDLFPISCLVLSIALLCGAWTTSDARHMKLVRGRSESN